MSENASKPSNIGLEIYFDATADTPRYSKDEIAARVATFIAATMDAANVRVEVHGSWLNYTAAYHAERRAHEVREAAKQRDPFAGSPESDALN